jgi:hypothetical protein
MPPWQQHHWTMSALPCTAGSHATVNWNSTLPRRWQRHATTMRSRPSICRIPEMVEEGGACAGRCRWSPASEWVGAGQSCAKSLTFPWCHRHGEARQARSPWARLLQAARWTTISLSLPTASISVREERGARARYRWPDQGARLGANSVPLGKATVAVRPGKCGNSTSMKNHGVHDRWGDGIHRASFGCSQLGIEPKSMVTPVLGPGGLNTGPRLWRVRLNRPNFLLSPVLPKRLCLTGV